MLKKGLVHKVCRRGTQIRQLFLFSDILIYSSPSMIEEHYHFHRIIPLAILTIERGRLDTYTRFCLKFITNEKSFLVFTGSKTFTQILKKKSKIGRILFLMLKRNSRKTEIVLEKVCIWRRNQQINSQHQFGCPI